MSLAVTINHHWTDGKRIHVIGSVVASGNYVTNGDTIDLSDQKIKSPSVPIFVYVTGQSSNMFKFVPGTTKANGKLKAFVGTTGVEVAAGAYPGGITGDTLLVYAIFHQLR